MPVKKAVVLLLCLLLVAMTAATAWLWAMHLLPRRFSAQVEPLCLEFELPSDLVYAVCFQESRFDPRAVSSAGACGLMQLMPDTYRWIAQKMGEDLREEEIFDPDINLRLGCWYLSYLRQRFGNDETVMLAAYNAGPNKVDEWLKNEAYAPEGELAQVPYPETAHYVERVLLLKKLYGWIYFW